MTREGDREVDVLVAAWNRADIDDGSADNTADCVYLRQSICENGFRAGGPLTRIMHITGCVYFNYTFMLDFNCRYPRSALFSRPLWLLTGARVGSRLRR